MHVPVRARRPRRAAPVALALSLTGGLLYCATPQHPATTVAPRAAPAVSSARLTAARASAQARATGQAVVADALTTATSQTTANPNGSFTLTTSPAPVRVARGGAWVSLDATLARNPDASYSPAATPTGLVLSGGGSGPLAVLSNHGRRLSVSLPVTLPAPTVSGASATYPNLLPDVDLVVTATAQGGYSDVFVVKTAAAAANPALNTLMTSHLTGSGVNLSTDAAGNLTAATPTGVPIFTAPAATGWDSAAASTTPGLDRSTGAPLTSTLDSPGEGAHQASLGATLTAGTLSLSPPVSLLTGSTAKYPVYLDPSVGPAVASWTMTNSIYGSTSYYGSGTAHHMQVGYQGWQSPTFKAHSFTTLNLSGVPSGAVVSSAQVNFWEDTAPSCTATQVDLYTTGPISSSTTWNNEPAWGTFIGGKNAAMGYPGCSPGGIGWDITPEVTSALSGGDSTLTLGLRAHDESDKYGWKQFNGNVSGETSTNAQVVYDLYPNTPAGLYTSPATDCATTTLGDTAVTLYAPAFTGTGQNLTTTFTLYKTSDTNTRTNLLTPANNIPSDTYSGPSGQPAVITVPETFFKTLANNTMTSFSWQAQSTDGTLTSDWSGACVFNWDPSSPGAPGVAATTSPTTGNTCPLVPTTPAYPVGTLCSFTLTAPNNATISGYLYQLNQAPPVTVSATGTTTITLTLPRIVNTLTVSALSPGGNIGSVTKATIDTTSITPPAKDGDLTNDGTPDLIIPGATTANSNAPAGLWLATTKPDGTLTPAMTNIGTAGLGLSSPPTATDYNGTQTITGDYCGLGAQDVLAYVPGATTAANPNGGGGAVACSDGSTSPLHPLNPVSGAAYSVNPQTFQDSGTNATQIVGGGTQTFTDATVTVNLFYGTVTTGSTSQLDAFGMPAGSFDQATAIDLATQPTPTGGTDWNNWTVTTAQLATGTAMYLWNPTTGDLYLWTAVTLNSTTFGDVTGITYTQTKIASGWHTGAGHLLLRAADINNDTIPDLWAVNTAPGTALTATAYLPTTLADNPTLTTTTTTLFTSSHAWPLQDIGTNSPGSTATSSSDIAGGLNLTGTTGATWNTNDAFSPDVALNGASGTLATAGAAVTPNADFTLSMWVKPAAGGGTVISQDGAHDSSFTVGLTADGHWRIAMNNNATTTASYDTDTGTTAPLGAWTQLTLSYRSDTRTLALYTGTTLTAALNATAPPATGGPLRLGAQQTNTTITGYYTGQVAQVQTWNSVLTTAITPAAGTLGDVTGDTKPDLLAIDPSGNLLLYPNTGGTGITTFGANGPTQVGSGWTGFTLDAVADLDHSNRAGLLATTPTGTLLYYPNTGATGLGTFGAPTQVGTGWSAMRIIGLTDLYSKGTDGILTINTTNGTLLYYPNTTGTGAITFGTPDQVGSGWNNLTAVVGTVDNDTKPDLLALDTSGNLSLYTNAGGTGLNTFPNPPTPVGTGLSGYKLTALSDPYTTGRNGYISLNTTNSNLYYTPNTGGTGLSTFGTPTLIGTGWNPYTIN